MLVTTETSLTAVPTPRSRIPPRAVSVTATCTRGSSSTRAAPPGPGPVAGLHLLAVDEDAVGGRPAGRPAAGLDQVRDQPGGRGLAVGAGHRDHRDRRAQRARSSRPGRDRPAPPGPRRARRPGRSPCAGDGGERPGHGQSPNSSAVPRCRNGKATTTVSSSPGRPTAATLVRSRAGGAADHGRGQLGGGQRAGRGVRQADRGFAHPQRPLPGHHRGRFGAEHPAGVQRQLDRGPGEVQVRPGQHP